MKKRLLVYLPDAVYEMLEELVKAGVYPNKSDAARTALTKYITREYRLFFDGGRRNVAPRR